jgi:hypothetical protein
MSKMHLYPVPEQNALDVFAHLDPCWPPAGPAARPDGEATRRAPTTPLRAR